MTLDDLIDRATAATAGLTSGRLSGQSAAVEAHRRLAAALAPASNRRGKHSMVTSRQRVLAVANAVTLWVADRGLEALDALARSGCVFRFQCLDSAGSESIATFQLTEVGPVREAPGVLRLAKSLRRLPPPDQRELMRAFDFEAKLFAAEAAYFGAKIAGTEGVAEPERDMLASKRDTEQAVGRLSPAAKDWLRTEGNLPFDSVWYTWALPVELALDASDRELVEASMWLDRTATAMYRPLPMDCAAPDGKLAVWRSAWSTYEDAGDAFAVVAAWLRCLAATSASRRCAVCYRHLGPELKKFCCVHRRTSAARQQARDLHVSKLYKASLPFQQPTSPERVGKDLCAPNELEFARMTRAAREDGLPPDLLGSAASLAAMLRALWPVLHPGVEMKLRDHFLRFLQVVQVPYRQSSPSSPELAARLAAAQREARLWLGWEKFFLTWFGRPIAAPFASGRTIGEGLDVDHPICDGGSVSPQKVALDLAHFRCWTTASATFDQTAYLDPEKVKALRDTGQTPGSRPQSLRRLGEILGASPEAIRKALAEPPSKPQDGVQRRKRVLPIGLRRLVTERTG